MHHVHQSACRAVVVFIMFLNPVVMGFQIFLLVDYGKVLCFSANELYQNSNVSSKEEYIPRILTVLNRSFFLWRS